MIKIGLLREEKNPQDYRVAFTPLQCKILKQQYPHIQIIVQPSDIRCYTDLEYIEKGIIIAEDLSDCDYIFGVKEVPKENLIEGKTYFFFSHTIKQQLYNKPLMQALIQKKVRMIDYECLKNNVGHRIVGFGKWAGIVGAHNGLLTYGKKYDLFKLEPAHSVEDYTALKELYKTIVWPPMKIVVTGGGRVATGLLEIMDVCGFKEVSEDEFLNEEFDKPVYVHLGIDQLYRRKDDSSFDKKDFYAHPSEYCCPFREYTHVADILMNGIFWAKDIPPYFNKEDIRHPDFRMNVIADVTCDKEGSVPINYGATTIQDPTYGIDKKSLKRVAPYQNTKETIDLMTVDNLPSELPKSASEHFGHVLSEYIIPEILQEDKSTVLLHATICENGELKDRFKYLHDFAYT